jgi:hypothetical protein
LITLRVGLTSIIHPPAGKKMMPEKLARTQFIGPSKNRRRLNRDGSLLQQALSLALAAIEVIIAG